MITFEDIVNQWGKKQDIVDECMRWWIPLSECEEYVEADKKLKEMLKEYEQQKDKL